jgi:serine/threonine-protein kinase
MTVPHEKREPFVSGEEFAGRYRMIARIGRGGMGDVWRADDLVLQTPVALKLILSNNAAAKERMVKEVRLARQITHPAVCRVFDVGESSGQVFLTMELVAGEDLSTLLHHVGRLPSEKVSEIGQQLCAGLAAAHAQGVLHRDLKPANILIDDSGQVHITDFGIAILRAESGAHLPIGTPEYMAPEQLTTGAPLTERTDLYALGLVLYELITGVRPRASAGGHLPRPSSLAPNIDPRLERAIVQATAATRSTVPSRRPRWRPRCRAAMHYRPATRRARVRGSVSGSPARWSRRWRLRQWACSCTFPAAPVR